MTCKYRVLHIALAASLIWALSAMPLLAQEGELPAAPDAATSSDLPASEASSAIETGVDPESLASDQVGIVRGRGAALLSANGASLVAELPAGTLVLLLGRSQDGSMIFVSSGPTSGESGTGWVAAGSLLNTGVVDLPVREVEESMDEEISESETAEGEIVEQEIREIDNEALPVAEETNSRRQASDAITGRVTLTNSRLNLRAGPSTAYPIVGKAEPASTWTVVGRTADESWVRVLGDSDEADEADEQWAATRFLEVDGSLNEVDVMEPSAPPPIVTPSPRPSATRAPEPTATLSDESEPDGGEPNEQDPAESEVTNTPAAAPAQTGQTGQTGLAGTLVFQDRIGGTIQAYSLSDDRLWTITGGIDPAISPDGQRVAFTRGGGDGGVYVIGIDGSNEQRLYNGQEILRSPKWSPDGQYIVFSRSNGYEQCRVLDGGVCLPDEAILDSLPPALQGADAKNAVRGLPDNRAYYFALSRINPTGGAYRDIASLRFAHAPDWSEAGIVYHSSGSGIQITADEGDARSREVANNALLGYYQDPDWQPGGGRIAFHRQMTGDHWQIFGVNPDGGGEVALTRPVTVLVDELPSSVSPAWSPDGQHIVYLSSRNSIESAGSWHLWVMNADGSNQRRLPIEAALDYTFSAEQVVSWGP